MGREVFLDVLRRLGVVSYRVARQVRGRVKGCSRLLVNVLVSLDRVQGLLVVGRLGKLKRILHLVLVVLGYSLS